MSVNHAFSTKLVTHTFHFLEGSPNSEKIILSLNGAFAIQKELIALDYNISEFSLLLTADAYTLQGAL